MFEHYTVMKEEAVNGLAVKPDGVYVDCTVGGGGHSERIVSQLSENGLLIAFDQDEEALEAAKKRLEMYSDQILFIHIIFDKSKKNC